MLHIDNLLEILLSLRTILKKYYHLKNIKTSRASGDPRNKSLATKVNFSMFQKEARIVQIKNMKFTFPDFGTILPLLLTNFINKNQKNKWKQNFSKKRAISVCSPYGALTS